MVSIMYADNGNTVNRERNKEPESSQKPNLRFALSVESVLHQFSPKKSSCPSDYSSMSALRIILLSAVQT